MGDAQLALALALAAQRLFRETFSSVARRRAARPAGMLAGLQVKGKELAHQACRSGLCR